ncbi:uncharacterized protein LOC129566796 [Sitodiplosis mosellana]|uniref:uncharacterized protein LOC129566796 n=1 Tax=Sitodiplosis mosellana TaxID=263140 RepID=UPI0024446337|nr:uncharacterized protein LOC129566796 [Sitodiplosis mosellana]
MKVPTVGFCCQLHCVTDLTTGGILIGCFEAALGIVLSVMSLANFLFFIMAVIYLVVNVCWLYGIERSRPSYLFPNIVLSSIIIVLIYIADILLLCFIVYFEASGTPMINEYLYLVPLFFLIYLTPLATYFMVVKYSIYKKAMRELSQKLCSPFELVV